MLIELKDNLKGFLGNRLERMVLFGSRARGDYEDESDIDIAIIVHGLTRELKNQILDTVAAIELKYLQPISVIVLSKEVFDRLKRQERRIALDVEKEGLTL
ncbi:MAG: Nucleotidyltransferase domain protein [Candidatus Brocadia sinica]|nr:MAG: Nucleotidyltransferase domain protein [Candidatus Brocadia sinica]